MDNEAQASLEYMMMLSLALGVFAVILYVVGTLVSAAGTQLGIDTSYRAVEEIKEAVDFVYIHGEPSKLRISVYFPPSIYNLSVYANKVIDARLDVAPYYTDIYAVTRGNITFDEANLAKISHEGYYVINVESIDPDWVNITVE